MSMPSMTKFRHAWRDASYGGLTTGPQREVVSVIVDRCNPTKGTGYTGGDAGLARDMGVSLATAKRARRAAVASGWIVELRKGEPGVNGEYAYAIPGAKEKPAPAVEEKPAQSCHRDFWFTRADCKGIIGGKLSANVKAAVQFGIDQADYERYGWQGHIIGECKKAWHEQSGNPGQTWRAPGVRVPIGGKCEHGG